MVFCCPAGPAELSLLQGGITFNGRLYFNRSDSGSATKPIVIDSYGSGRATIYSDTTYGMYLYNTGGFIIRNLIQESFNDIAQGLRLQKNPRSFFSSTLKALLVVVAARDNAADDLSHSNQAGGGTEWVCHGRLAALVLTTVLCPVSVECSCAPQ